MQIWHLVEDKKQQNNKTKRDKKRVKKNRRKTHRKNARRTKIVKILTYCKDFSNKN